MSVRISREQFYKLCEWIKKNRTDLINQRPGNKRLAALATSALGFPIATRSAAEARRASGVIWHTAPEPLGGGDRHTRMSSDVRAAIRAIRALYLELGLNVPEGLERAYLRIGERVIPNDQESDPVSS